MVPDHFLAFLKAGLAYRAEAPVNWCPGADGARQRAGARRRHVRPSGDLVIRKNLEQWFFRITDYAEELLNDIDTSTGPSV